MCPPDYPHGEQQQPANQEDDKQPDSSSDHDGGTSNNSLDTIMARAKKAANHIWLLQHARACDGSCAIRGPAASGPGRRGGADAATAAAAAAAPAARLCLICSLVARNDAQYQAATAAARSAGGGESPGLRRPVPRPRSVSYIGHDRLKLKLQFHQRLRIDSIAEEPMLECEGSEESFDEGEDHEYTLSSSPNDSTCGSCDGNSNQNVVSSSGGSGSGNGHRSSGSSGGSSGSGSRYGRSSSSGGSGSCSSSYSSRSGGGGSKSGGSVGGSSSSSSSGGGNTSSSGHSSSGSSINASIWSGAANTGQETAETEHSAERYGAHAPKVSVSRLDRGGERSAAVGRRHAD
ncbi:hypothetical protein JKP88DRAFT_353774 [Tribonema minus]|uniref:Uncharacterized protein n=1 Tax=Tribonema minus TaxID=303371 RepID=A0A835Z6V3_9STRA|nr:hypothetical protein JKP88DRAFT_353774 [Tribonema minus]